MNKKKVETFIISCFMVCVILISSIIIIRNSPGIGIFSDPPGIGRIIGLTNTKI